MIISKAKKEKRERRHKRIRSRVFGTKELPRLSVFKSNRYISAQLVDDVSGQTLAAAHSKEVKAKTPVARAKEVGNEIAKKAKDKKILQVVFDRGGYIYTGNVKAVAEGAREGGLKF